ncbi:MAG: TIGR03086 family metal-binding protein [Acidimicrobiales bacterium]
MDPNELLALSTTNFLSVLDPVTDVELALATPCESWSVADLIWHVARASDMTVLLIAGASKEEATDLFKMAVPPDVLAQCRRALSEQAIAFANASDPEFIVHHPMGDFPVHQLFDFRIMDLTLHAWDLARAIGESEALPEVLVTHVYARLLPLKEVIGQIGIFGLGPSDDLDDDASTQLKLLDLTGRRP